MTNPSAPSLRNMAVNGDILPPHARDPSHIDDLGAIRALLLATLRHHSIQIPKEATPLGITTGDVHPKKGVYDESRTIDYHITQLPRRLALSSQQSWHTHFKLSLTATTPVTRQTLEAGMSSVLSWSIHTRNLLQAGHIDYDAFGYDWDGNIRILVRHRSSASSPDLQIREHIVCLSNRRLDMLYSRASD